MSKIRLKFKSVSEIVGSADVALLTLTDESEQKQLSIVCDKAMAYQLTMRVGNASVVRTLLPEVLCRMISIHTDLKLEILINGLVDGQYKAIIYDTDTLTPLSIRVSDAVLLSFVGNIPLYIDEYLMRRQAVNFFEGSRGVAIPVNTLNEDMLNEALEKAIKEENYELASQLRDEKRRRKKEN